MFLVIEIQKSEDGTLSTLTTQHDTQRDAKSKYHAILSFAAKSGLRRHGAVIMNEDGRTIMCESYVSGETAEE